MMTVIGEDVVVNFTGSADHYTCAPNIKLLSGRRLCFPSFKCSTCKVGISISIFNLIVFHYLIMKLARVITVEMYLV